MSCGFAQSVLPHSAPRERQHCQARPDGRRFVARRDVRVHGWIKSQADIEIETSRADVFDAYYNGLDEISEWAPLIKSVEIVDEQKGLSKWNFSANGINLSWFAKNTEIIEDEKIAWKSISGLPNRGEVIFKDGSSESSTLVTLHIQFEAPDIVTRVFDNSYIRNFMTRKFKYGNVQGMQMAFIVSCNRASVKRRNTVICAGSGGFVEENQYTLREKQARVVANQFNLEDLPLQRHTHLFIRDELDETFESGFRRHVKNLKERVEGPGGSFLLLGEHIADPSWGRNRRRPPEHPRYLIIEDLDKDGNGEGSLETAKWLETLESQIGSQLLRDMSHKVDYRLILREGDLRLGINPVRDLDDFIVVMEMVNADWTSLDKVKSTSQVMQKRGRELVDSGVGLHFQLLQSEREPSFFKSIEVYADEDTLVEHVQKTDGQYSDELEPYKAAVNRVRQAFRLLRP